MEPTSQPELNAAPRRWPRRVLAVCALLLLVSGSATWLQRDRIVGNLIDGFLAEKGIAARYSLVEITPTRQVIADLVVGDPAAPDLVADEVVVDIGLGLLGPVVSQVTIEKARLFGSLRGGVPSFGSLDPLIFAESTEPAGLPQINLALKDARARIDSDFGTIGVKVDGAGRLDDGFAGTLAVTAPGIGEGDCRAAQASLFGALTTAGGEARLNGPLRLRESQCAGISLAQADIGTALTLGKTLDEVRGKFALAGRSLDAGAGKAAELAGSATAAISAKGVVIDLDLTLRRITSEQATLASASAKGAWRALADAERSEWSGTVEAQGIALAAPVTDALAEARIAAAGTLAEPLLAQFTTAMARALDGASFTSEVIVRLSDEDTRLVIPEARLRSGTREIVAALSQVNWSLGESGAGIRRGNLLLGGTGLPRINGRILQGERGGVGLRLAMADYRAGDSSLAIPRLTIEPDAAGVTRFSGLLVASGALPGGRVSGLEVPLEGRWSAGVGLALGTRCAPLRFTGLELAGMELAARALTLCPADRADAMLRYGNSLTIAAATSKLDLAGRMGSEPARIAANRAVLRYPGALAIEGVDVQLGGGSTVTRLTLDRLTGALGESAQGEFSGAAGGLAAVPLDLASAEGRWQFVDGALMISDASFRLTDRSEGQPRFEPLVGKGAKLTMQGDSITADAGLYHPASGQQVARFNLEHDLAKAVGAADVMVDNLTFSPALDVENLTYLAKGVIAGARGMVRGRGRIDWAGDKVTSTGRFASDGLDFAAAFGPVTGLKGELVFTDLLGLTTAPDQRLEIAAINTGVEVLDGRIRFSLTEGTMVKLADARWPFMGGELILRPVVLDFGRPSIKRYVFEMNGLDAAIFIAEMELTNLGATGIFDGVVPIVFDASGNGRIEDGLLTARAPGGNIAYVGDLTYEDMGAISNYAFRALRSLDYRDMSVVLEGSLTGEIISKFQFGGVRQGEGTSRNVITRRLAKLPILFRVNVKAESFFELSTVVRSFFDVSYLGNPVDRGLLKLEDGRFTPTRQPVPARPDAAPQQPPGLRPSDTFVQPPESEDRP